MLNWHWMNMYAMKNAGTAPTGAVVPTPAAPVGYPLPVGPLSFTTAAGTPFGPVPFVPPVARPALVEDEDEEDEESTRTTTTVATTTTATTTTRTR